MSLRAVTVMLALVLGAGMAGADRTVEVFIHGDRQLFSPPAQVHGGLAYAPLRGIAEALGAEVEWEAERQVAVVTADGRSTEVPKAWGLEVYGRLLVPIRTLAEALGAEVEWHAEERQISIRTGVPGMKAAPIVLPGVDGPYARTRFDDRPAVVVVFWANHCPTVHAYEQRFIALVEDYEPRGVEFVAVGSNCGEQYPADNFENMKIRAQEKGYNFHYVRDEDQEVARAYAPERTPDAYVISPEGFVVYRGRIEDAENPERVTRHDLREALDELLVSRPVTVKETPPHGCTIKWKN